MVVGFIGLGIMGYPMCRNLLAKNRDQDLYFYQRSRKNLAELLAAGAHAAEHAAEVVQKSEVIFTMVGSGTDVESLYREILPAIECGKILVDMSTIAVDLSQEVAEQVAARGGIMLDAPVVKSKAAAMDGTLGIYVGGDLAAYEKIRPLLECMGSNIFYLGGKGAGLTMKICHNMLVAQIQNGVNEMLTLAQKLGIPVTVFQQAVNSGGGSNFYLNAKAANIAQRNFETAFSVRNMHKDVHIAQKMARGMGLDFPGIDTVCQIYERAMQQGLAEQDFSATYLTVSQSQESAQS